MTQINIKSKFDRLEVTGCTLTAEKTSRRCCWNNNRICWKSCSMRSLKCNLYNLSSSGRLVDYESAWKFQKALAERAFQYHKQGSEPVDSILLVQHPSVYTLGRGATPDNIKFKVTLNSPHKVVRVERGGEVTWHGPGQLVAYPILNLNYHKRDLHW